MPRLLIDLASFAALGCASAVQAAPVEIDLTGVRAGGRLYVQLQARDDYMGPRRQAGKIIDAPAAGNLALSFDVPPGDYAATVWHDDDGNGRFDVDRATGRPLDGWAIASSGTPAGASTFDQVKLIVPAVGTKVAMPLRYGR